jgi:O-antigen/teichoic acid export membrane protein
MASSRPTVVLKHASSILAVFHGKGLINETIKTMAFSVAIILINMATGMITARMLGPEGRGVLAAIILWPQFLSFATTLGLHSALLFHVKKTPEDEGSLYYASLFLSGFTGLFAIIAGVLLIPYWVEAHTPTTVVIAQCLMLVAPFMHLYFLNTAFFRAREQFHLFNRMRYIIPLLTLFTLLLLSFMELLTPFTAGLAYFAPYVPVTLWSVIHGTRLHPSPRLLGLRSAIRRIVKYGMESYGIDLLGNMILYMDQIILVSLLAPGPLGLYVVAVSLSRMVNIFSSSIIMVLFPKVSGLTDEDAAHLSLRVFKFSTAFALIGASIIMLIAPLVIRLLYGELFLESIPVFRLLLLEVVLGGAAMVLGQAFMAIGKPMILTISQGIGIILIIPLMYVLVPRYGITGAGFALLIPALIRLMYVIIAFQRKFHFGIRALFITKKDLAWVKTMIKSRKKLLGGSEGPSC